MKALVLLVLSGSGYAWGRDAYTVREYPVYAQAQSEQTAKAQALREGYRQAGLVLVRRLVPRAWWNEVQMEESLENPAVAQSLIHAVSTSDERIGGGAYRANLTIQFSPPKMRSWLQALKAPYADVLSPPLLVIPILQDGGDVYLWETGNRLLAAFQRTPSRGLIPFRVPLGDLEDAVAVNTRALFGARWRASVQPLMERYGAQGVVLVRATVPRNPATRDIEGLVLVNMVVVGAGWQDWQDEIAVALTDAGSESSMHVRLMAAAMGAMEEQWKAWHATAPDAPVQTLMLKTRGLSLEQWVVLRQVLERLSHVRKLNVQTITSASITLEIRYAGSEETLIRAVRRQGFALHSPLSDGHWTLESS